MTTTTPTTKLDFMIPQQERLKWWKRFPYFQKMRNGPNFFISDKKNSIKIMIFNLKNVMRLNYPKKRKTLKLMS